MQAYVQSSATHSAYDLGNWTPVLEKLSANAVPLTLTEESDPTELLTRLVADFRSCALLGEEDRSAMRERVHAEFDVGLQSSLQYTYPCGHQAQRVEAHGEEMETYLAVFPPDGATRMKLSEFMAQPGGVLGDYGKAPDDFRVEEVCVECNAQATVMKKWTCRPKSSTLMIAVERYRVTQYDFTNRKGAIADDLTYVKTGTHVEPDDLVFDGVRYSLRAVIQHIGASPTSGHYVTFAKNGDGPKGIVRCSDGKCEEIDAFPTDAFTNSRLLVYTSGKGGSAVDTQSDPVRVDANPLNAVSARLETKPPCKRMTAHWSPLETPTAKVSVRVRKTKPVRRNVVSVPAVATATVDTDVNADVVIKPAAKVLKRAPNLSREQLAWVVAKHDELTKMTMGIAVKGSAYWDQIHEAAVAEKMIDPVYKVDSLRNVVERARMRRIRVGV